MKIYDFSNVTDVFFGGSICDNEESVMSTVFSGLSDGIEEPIHPKEIERQERLNQRKNKRRPGNNANDSFSLSAPIHYSQVKAYRPRGNGRYNNSVIIFTGGSGFGTKNEGFFEDILGKLNEALSKNNANALFVRGAMDDPSFFNEHKLDFSNIKLVEDYSLIKFKGFNILCIGGGVSIDRQWKLEQGKRLGKTMYFTKEKSTFNKEELDNILKEYNVACVVTSEAPTFVPPDMESIKASKWTVSDKNLMKDVISQRLIMDSIYNEFILNDKKPYIWAYGSSLDNSITLNNIRFISISSGNILIDAQDVAEEVFGFHLSGDKYSGKVKKMPKKMPWNRAPENEPRQAGQGLEGMRLDVPNVAVRHDAEDDMPTIDGGAALGYIDDNPYVAQLREATAQVDARILEEMGRLRGTQVNVNPGMINAVDAYAPVPHWEMTTIDSAEATADITATLAANRTHVVNE